MRRLGLSTEDIEVVVARPDHTDTDLSGRPRFTAQRGSYRVRVVLAVDRPDLVVTVHERRN